MMPSRAAYDNKQDSCPFSLPVSQPITTGMAVVLRKSRARNQPDFFFSVAPFCSQSWPYHRGRARASERRSTTYQHLHAGRPAPPSPCTCTRQICAAGRIHNRPHNNSTSWRVFKEKTISRETKKSLLRICTSSSVYPKNNAVKRKHSK